MKNKFLLLIPALLMAFGCTDGGNDNNNNSNGGTTPDPTPQQTLYTETFYTFGSDYGTAFPQSSWESQDKSTALKTYFESQTSKTGLVKSISYTNLNSMTVESNSPVYMTIGKGDFTKDAFMAGSLTWTSDKPITKVEITASTYTRHISYTGYDAWRPDYNGHVLLDDVEESLEVTEATSEIERKEVSKTYDTSVKTFTIQSKNSRVFLEQIKITFDLSE